MSSVLYVCSIRFDLSYTSAAVLTVITHVQQKKECIFFTHRGLHRHRIFFSPGNIFFGGLISPCTRGRIFWFHFPTVIEHHLFSIHGGGGTDYFVPGICFFFFPNSTGRRSAWFGRINNFLVFIWSWATINFPESITRKLIVIQLRIHDRRGALHIVRSPHWRPLSWIERGEHFISKYRYNIDTRTYGQLRRVSSKEKIRKTDSNQL